MPAHPQDWDVARTTKHSSLGHKLLNHEHHLHVDFHRPATPGQLRAIGRPVKMGRQMSVAETRIVRADGTSWRVEEALMLAARLAALRSCLILARMPVIFSSGDSFSSN